MSDDTHEIYAIRYGHHDRKSAENFIGGDPLTDPHPNPSPQGGGERTERAALAIGYSLLVTITPGAPLPAPVA